jgi:phosphoribosylformylglycinamidine synthase
MLGRVWAGGNWAGARVALGLDSRLWRGFSSDMGVSPAALVLRAAGTNCEQEMLRGFSLAGASPTLMHVDEFIAQPSLLERYQLVGFPGGFSYGDDIASGRIFGMRVREKLYPALRTAVVRGVPMIGACNGFQVLVQTGLLPGAPRDDASNQAPAQALALTDNASGRFVDRWVDVSYEPSSVCIWTKGLATELAASAAGDDASCLPVAHGEGRLVASNESVLDGLRARGQVVLRYRDNFNGSSDAIAGVCDPTGLVFGLMPHPERFLDWTRHPAWTRLSSEARAGVAPGLAIFQKAIAWVRAM